MPLVDACLLSTHVSCRRMSLVDAFLLSTHVSCRRMSLVDVFINYDSVRFFSDKYTVEEWLEQNILPLSEKMAELNNMAEILTKQNHWPRRPV